jgi:hypothetical protein
VQILCIRIKDKTKRKHNCILFILSNNKNKHKKGANNPSHNKGPQEKYNIWQMYLHEGATKLNVLQHEHLQRSPPTTNKHTNFFYKHAIVISR